MGKIMLRGYKCERCYHVWVPRTKVQQLPTICPSCKSPYWNLPKQGKRLNEAYRRLLLRKRLHGTV